MSAKPDALTAGIARDYGEEFLRELVAELTAPRLSAPLRVHPLPRRRQWPTNVSAEEERELVRLWREELDEDMLNALVNAHRPMLENMARRLSSHHFGLLIEYGILGLRIAATHQRSSKTKKGKLAGFDPSKGRFSTYGRHVAERFMVAAAQAMGGVVIVKGLRDVDDAIVIYGDRFSECLGPRFEDKKEEFAAWAKTPIPIEIGRERANYIERPNEIAEIGPRVAMVDYDDFRLWGVPVPGGLEPLPGHI